MRAMRTSFVGFACSHDRKVAARSRASRAIAIDSAVPISDSFCARSSALWRNRGTELLLSCIVAPVAASGRVGERAPAGCLQDPLHRLGVGDALQHGLEALSLGFAERAARRDGARP